MNYKLNTDQTVAVDVGYYWQPIATCPFSVKVQLLGKGGVAHYGTYFGVGDFYTHWAPLPRMPKDK